MTTQISSRKQNQITMHDDDDIKQMMRAVSKSINFLIFPTELL